MRSINRFSNLSQAPLLRKYAPWQDGIPFRIRTVAVIRHVDSKMIRPHCKICRIFKRFDSITHRVDKSTRLFFQSSELGPPPAHRQTSVPLPLGSRGGGAHLLAGKAGPNSDEGTDNGETSLNHYFTTHYDSD